MAKIATKGIVNSMAIVTVLTMDKIELIQSWGALLTGPTTLIEDQ